MLDLAAIAGTAGLIAVAELGDKSQLVCLVLASRYGPVRVILGAALAFSALNALAVAGGSLLAGLIPVEIAHGVAAAVFLAFGLHTLLARDDEAAPLEARTGAPVLVTAAVLALAELGDKTQLAVAGLATVNPPVSTWLGATLALIGTSALAATVGAAVLPRLPRRAVRVVAGLGFVAVAVWLLVGLFLGPGDAGVYER